MHVQCAYRDAKVACSCHHKTGHAIAWAACNTTATPVENDQHLHQTILTTTKQTCACMCSARTEMQKWHVHATTRLAMQLHANRYHSFMQTVIKFHIIAAYKPQIELDLLFYLQPVHTCNAVAHSRNRPYLRLDDRDGASQIGPRPPMHDAVLRFRVRPPRHLQHGRHGRRHRHRRLDGAWACGILACK